MNKQPHMLVVKSKTLFKFQETGGQTAAYTDPTTATIVTSITRGGGTVHTRNAGLSQNKG